MLEDTKSQGCDRCVHLTYTCLKLQQCHDISTKKCDVHIIQLYGGCEYLETVGQMWLVTIFRSPQYVVS